MYIFLNNSIILKEEATISPFDHGFLFGDAIFETLQYKDSCIIDLIKHLERLHFSASKIQITIPNIDFKSIILKLIRKNKLTHTRIRITISRGQNNTDFNTCTNPTILIFTQKIQKEKTSLQESKTCTLKIERVLPIIKSTQLLPFILAKQKMKQGSFDECFFISKNNEITEGSVSNIFFIKNNEIYTSNDESCLEGTIKLNILAICKKKGIVVNKCPIKYSKISQFSESFWTNSIHTIVPIKSIDNFQFTCIGPLTQKIISLYKKLK